MDKITLEEEAQDCRRKALAYVGQAEAPFLLRLAREFDRLAAEHHRARGTEWYAEAEPS